MNSRIYYLPGRTGTVEKSFIVQCVLELGVEVVGRNLHKLDFTEQLSIIEQDILDNPNRRIICNSYGCYLLLQTLIQMDKPITMPICMFSPVIGGGFATEGGTFYGVYPPRSDYIYNTINDGRLTFNPDTTFIHAGEHDQGTIDHFGGATVSIVKDTGHDLSGDDIKKALSDFLSLD